MDEQEPGYFEPVGPLGELLLPQSGSEATEGRVIRWLKPERAIARQGEPMVEIAMSDQIYTIAAPHAGTLWWHSVEAGAVISPGARLGWLLPGELPTVHPAAPEESRLWRIITVLASVGMLIFALLTIILAIHASMGR